MRTLKAVFCGSLCLLVPVLANAQVFTTRAAWASALFGGQTTLDFGGLTPQTGLATGPFALSGATLDAVPGSHLYVLEPWWNPVDTDWGTGAVLHPEDGLPMSSFTITLPGAFSAFGLDFGDAQPAAYTLGLSNGQQFTFASVPPGGPPKALSFWGIIGASPFTTITIGASDTDAEGLAMFDNVSWGNGAAVSVTPEPGTLMLLAVGLAGLGIPAWRRRH